MNTRYENGVVPKRAVDARRSIADEMRRTRIQMNMTQQTLADAAGTKKSNISRMESGNYNPSLDFLVKVAECLGKTIQIHMD